MVSPLSLRHLHHVMAVFVVGSGLVHVVCCGIPLAMTVLSGMAVVGASGTAALAHDNLEPYEKPMLVVAGVMLVLTALVHFGMKRYRQAQTKAAHGHCACPDHARTIRRGKRLLQISFALYGFNLVGFFLTHG